MSYSFRELRRINYNESEDTHDMELEDARSDDSNGHDLCWPENLRKRRKNAASTSRAAGTDLLRRPTRGTRSRHSYSNRTVQQIQNNEALETGQSSVIQRGCSVPPPPQAEMDTNVGRASSLHDEHPTAPNMEENNSPQQPLQVQEDSNSNVESCSFLREAPRPCVDNGCSLVHDAGQSSRTMKAAAAAKSLQERTAATSDKKTILSWLIELGLIDEDEQVYYMGDGRESAALTGIVTKGGILCSCCQEEISVWSFEVHAGSDLKQPYRHIFLAKEARCLQHLLIAAWDKDTERKRREAFTFVPKETSLSQHDDACSICGMGGVLMYCGKCPSAYHVHCMNIGRPHRDWLCPYCICKFCKLGGDSKQLVTCSQCEKKFHWQCFTERSTLKESSSISHSRLYCSQSCKEIYEKFDSALQETKTDFFDGYSWRVIHPTRILPTRDQCLENNSKVAVAYTLMNESFEAMVDPYTDVNLVQNVVFSCGSNLTRLNFNRFYTFVMEQDDAVICAASLRIHGERIAEMPFVTTDKAYRRQGICGMLMSTIESFLCKLKVQNLVIASGPDTHEMWKQKYGFNELTAELRREIANYNNLMFLGADRLFKYLSSCTEQECGNNGKDVENENVQETHMDQADNNGNEVENESVQETHMDQADNNGNEVENENVQETQQDQADRPLLDLNMEPPEEDQ